MAAFAAALILALGLAAALPAHALSCWPTPLRGERDQVHFKWSQATAAFVGRLQAVTPVGKPPEGHAAGAIEDIHQGTFEVLESFKGGASPVQALVPPDLRSGETYLVFVEHVDGRLRTRKSCGLQPNGPVALPDPLAQRTLATLRALPREGEGAVLYVKVHRDAQLEAVPVFLEGPRGSRVVALDRDGVVRVPALAPGDYHIRLESQPGRVNCMWSPQCGPLRLADRELAVAVLQVLRPTSVSSSR